MNKYLYYFRNEFTADLTWYISWILAIVLYSGFMIALYPGTEGMKSFLAIVNQPGLKAFIGNLDQTSSLFLIWMGIGATFLPILLAIFGFLTGVRITLKSINDGQGEIIYSVNIPKINHLIIRFLVALVVSIIVVLGWILPMVFPIVESIPIHILSSVSWIALLFLICTISLGIIIGLIFGSLDKAQLISLFIVIVFYSLQVLGGFSSSIDKLNSINVMTWFVPTSLMFGTKIESKTFLKLISVSVISLILATVGFIRKDLVKNSGMTLPGNLLKNRINSKKLFKKFFRPILLPFSFTFDIINRFFSSPKNSPFVILAKPVERRFPIAADFIYSEKKIIIIMVFVIALLWPGQLLAYPGDANAAKAILTVGANPIFKLFTYGHNLTGKPFLWWIGMQSIGAHWFYMLPLAFHWIKKITRADGENKFGEIIGSTPVTTDRILFERLLACFLMLVAYVVQMILWLLLVESALNKSYNTPWEIIAIVLVIPLYMFILSLGIFVSLLIKRHGFRYSSLKIIAIVLSFFASILGNNLNTWYIRGFFGLYDPIQIIQKTSISVDDYGSIILIGLSITLLYLIKLVTKNYNWLEYDLEKDAVPELTLLHD